ncbi:MAG: lysophospholipid acyltransferase family protein [Thermoanaerobaculales bacterium]|jgi:1-acyl-sn-glycerol-3-phosphate acyltransferase|nr:lysophospholipid acyltransferase family protein [Thermoanaerobaculales bacterium]
MPLPPLIPRETPICRWWRNLRVAPPVGVWFAVLIAVNLVQTLSLVVKPLSPRAFRRFNRWLAETWWGGCVVFAERFNGQRIIVSGEDLPDDENALVVSNHQQMPDITTIMSVARSKGRLGDLKFFVKRALKWVPGVGWGMQFLNCPFLERDWTADRERIARTFDTLVHERIPMWLVSFVEGTRTTQRKVLASAVWAAERGLEPTRHVLIPRTKGFVASVEGLGDHLHAIYDLTIGYIDGVPSLWQHITGRVKEIHVHVRRFPVDELPELEAELAQWLRDRFYEKDALLERFYATGTFQAEPAPVRE